MTFSQGPWRGQTGGPSPDPRGCTSLQWGPGAVPSLLLGEAGISERGMGSVVERSTDRQTVGPG